MAKKSKKAAPESDGVVSVLRNKKVRHDYEVLEELEAGMVLAGSEVKSLRNKDVQWGDGHARLDQRGELWLYGLHIGEYRQANLFNHAPQARRKLLLHRAQLDKLAGMLKTKGLSMVPSELLFRKGWAKCKIAVVRGRRKADKRKALVDRARQRDIDRELARRQKY